MNHKKRFRVFYVLNTNPNESRKDVDAISEDFAREDVGQYLTVLYSRHGFKIVRIEQLENLAK